MSDEKADGELSFREHLQSVVAASAGAYGYTLTIFSTGSVGAYMIGEPHIFEVLPFTAGAVVAFAAVEVVAYGSLQVRLRSRQGGRVEAWGHAHLLSASLAIVSSWALLQAVHTNVGWLLVGLNSTAIYLALNAFQGLLAARLAD